MSSTVFLEGFWVLYPSHERMLLSAGAGIVFPSHHPCSCHQLCNSNQSYLRDLGACLSKPSLNKIQLKTFWTVSKFERRATRLLLPKKQKASYVFALSSVLSLSPWCAWEGIHSRRTLRLLGGFGLRFFRPQTPLPKERCCSGEQGENFGMWASSLRIPAVELGMQIEHFHPEDPSCIRKNKHLEWVPSLRLPAAANPRGSRDFLCSLIFYADFCSIFSSFISLISHSPSFPRVFLPRSTLAL